MIIKKITIKNFRSIQKCAIDFDDLTIISGCNDSGKSNLLKALNLFFNNQTDHNTRFDFDADYCKFAVTPDKTAKEIQIELVLIPPQHFSNNRPFIWRKKWRKEQQDPISNEQFIRTPTKQDVHRTIKNWASKIKFKYVPALKGNNYFPHLLADLYNTLSISIESELKTAATDFISTIRHHTSTMENQLQEKLKLDSTIQLPSNLSSIFQILDFDTKHHGESISINHRGDGVKIRHIPSILKFVHDEDNRVTNKGEIKSSTIWGYEEPENNLELMASFEKANEMYNISKEIQIITTTHSPAFYSLATDHASIILYYTDQNNEGTNYKDITSKQEIDELDQKIGLLPLVAPYIHAKEQELQQTKEKVEELTTRINSEKNNLFVEGITDKLIFDFYLSTLEQETLNIEVKTGDPAGKEWVKNSAIAWSMHPDVETTEYKAYAILDNDFAGKDAKNKFHEAMTYMGRKAHSQKIKIELLTTPTHIQNINSCPGIEIPITLEETFSYEIWKHALDKHWLTPRKLSECVSSKYIDDDQTLRDYVKNKIPDETLNIYVFNKIKNNKKTTLANYVISEWENGNTDVFKGLEKSLNKIIQFFKQ